MTASELQRHVKTALDALGVPVTKDFSEFDGVFTHIVYREYSNGPALHADDNEVFFRVVYRITIVTDNDDYERLESDVENVMRRLGFMRSDAKDVPDNAFNRVLQFSAVKLKT